MLPIPAVLVLAFTLISTPADTEDRSLEHNGKTRAYRLHVPSSASAKGEPVPLVIVLHGAGANGKITEALTGFTRLGDRHTFAVAYPDGLAGLWRFWEGNRPVLAGRPARSDDVGFIESLIANLVKEEIADPRRVYVTGISNGAYMSNRLACDLADQIAAIAPVAGTIVRAMTESLKPLRPMPVIYFHGSDDKIVGIDGIDIFTRQPMSFSASELVAWWARNNGCAEPPIVDSLNDKVVDGTTVERRAFAVNGAGAPVVYYHIHGGGHTWPDGSFQPEALLGKTCHDISASELIWQFFSQHQLPESNKSAASR
jgi:polyhydroxybutyrate depolymerase